MDVFAGVWLKCRVVGRGVVQCGCSWRRRVWWWLLVGGGSRQACLRHNDECRQPKSIRPFLLWLNNRNSNNFSTHVTLPAAAESSSIIKSLLPEVLAIWLDGIDFGGQW